MSQEYRSEYHIELVYNWEKYWYSWSLRSPHLTPQFDIWIIQSSEDVSLYHQVWTTSVWTGPRLTETDGFETESNRTDSIGPVRSICVSRTHLNCLDRSVRSKCKLRPKTDRSGRYTSHTYKRWDVVWHLASDRCFIAIVMLHHLWDPQIPPHFVYVAWHLTVSGVLSLISGYISSPFQD